MGGLIAYAVLLVRVMEKYRFVEQIVKCWVSTTYRGGIKDISSNQIRVRTIGHISEQGWEVSLY